MQIEETSMKDMIYWLRTLEQLAMVVYRLAAEQMNDDQLFSSFLMRMSDDEELHYILLGNVGTDILKTNREQDVAIKFDNITRDEMRIPLVKLQDIMKKRKIGRKDILDCIIDVEFSEWNYLFVYLFKILQKSSKTVQYTASVIEAHKERIMKFIDELPPEMKDQKNLSSLPSIWERKILVVDNNEADRELISGILDKFGLIETAQDGWEGIEKINEIFFDVVISSMKLNEMNVIEFYQHAVEKEPRIGRRILFCLDMIPYEIKQFINENNLAYLEKPFAIRQLKQNVNYIIEKSL